MPSPTKRRVVHVSIVFLPFHKASSQERVLRSFSPHWLDASAFVYRFLETLISINISDKKRNSNLPLCRFARSHKRTHHHPCQFPLFLLRQGLEGIALFLFRDILR